MTAYGFPAPLDLGRRIGDAEGSDATSRADDRMRRLAPLARRLCVCHLSQRLGGMVEEERQHVTLQRIAAKCLVVEMVEIDWRRVERDRQFRDLAGYEGQTKRSGRRDFEPKCSRNGLRPDGPGPTILKHR
jgi:hypothetical protein